MAVFDLNGTSVIISGKTCSIPTVKRVYYLLTLEPLNDSLVTVCAQTSQSKKSKKASSKVISPVPSQVAALADSDRRPDKMSPREIIPHIVLNVKGEDCPSVTELLKMGTLPSLDQAWLAQCFSFYLVSCSSTFVLSILSTLFSTCLRSN